MKIRRKRLLWTTVSIITVICFLVLFALVKANFSPGEPKGICSVKVLLLEKSAFPLGTTMSSSENFEDFVVATVSHTFGNLDRGFDVNQAVEYYNASFMAAQVYAHNSHIFKRTKYNDSWQEPNEMTFSSQTSDQYRFACTNDIVVGHTCILIARYGRYFVLVSATLSEEFTVEDLEPLLQEIDSRMSPCIDQ